MRGLSVTRLIVPVAGLAALAAAVWLYGFGGADYLAARAAEGQRTVQNAMAGALRRLQARDPGALLSLWGLCFAYGFLHAAGPGHGKFLIGGYGLARRVAVRKLMAMSVIASLAQAATAVVLVVVGLTLLGWGRAEMQGMADRTFAMISDLLIAGIGLWLLWRGFRALGLVRRPVDNLGECVGAGTQKSTQGQSLAVRFSPVENTGDVAALGQLDQGLRARGDAVVSRDMSPVVCADCGHAHGPTPEQVAGMRSWRDGVVLIAAIAARPCTGALFLLLLTFRIGLEWAGIIGAFVMGLGTASVTLVVAAAAVSLRESALMQAASGQQVARVMACLELLAGGIVIAVAVQLLTGYL